MDVTAPVFTSAAESKPLEIWEPAYPVAEEGPVAQVRGVLDSFTSNVSSSQNEKPSRASSVEVTSRESTPATHMQPLQEEDAMSEDSADDDEHAEDESTADQADGESHARMSDIVHHGFSCDACQIEPIIGIRWSCTICKDDTSVDLCDKCNETASRLSHRPKHTPSHRMRKVSVPERYNGFGQGTFGYLDPSNNQVS